MKYLVFILASIGLALCAASWRQAGECFFFAVATGAAVNLLRKE